MKIRFTPLFALLCLVAACGSSRGFLNTDVLEPYGMTNPNQKEPVKMQGNLFQEGTLVYNGYGKVQDVYASYIEGMRDKGWTPAASEGDGNKTLSGRLVKDSRILHLSVTADESGALQVVIRVAPAK